MANEINITKEEALSMLKDLVFYVVIIILVHKYIVG